MSHEQGDSDLPVGDENHIEGTRNADTILGTLGNDTIIGHAGDDVIWGDALDLLAGNGSIETFDDTAEGEGFATTEAAWLGQWYAPIGHAVLDESHYNLAGSGHGQVLELASNQNTYITRVFNDLEQGQKLTLSFDIALPTADRVLGEDGIGIVWNGEVVGIHRPTQFDTWETLSFEIEAGAGNGDDQLYLVGVGPDDWWGAVIDNIAVSVPEEEVGGNDWIMSGTGNDWVHGGGGRDWLEGGEGRDSLNGGEGSDTATYLFAATGITANLTSGRGTRGDARGDTYESIENVHGSMHNDRIFGDELANRLNGRDGNDRLEGRGGNDYLLGGDGADRMDGGEGTDTAEYDWSTAGVVVDLGQGTGHGGYAEGDTLRNIENLFGSHHNDTLIGDDGVNRLNGSLGDDVLRGMSGKDTLIGGHGADHLDGGAGVDTADYSYSQEAVQVDLGANTGTGGDAEGDTFGAIENLFGSNFDDVLRGDGARNRLNGSEGDDALFGAEGNDHLIGGHGADALDGGAGNADVAVYNLASESVGVDLANGGFAGEAEGDTYEGIEFVYGSNFDDEIRGDEGRNRLDGHDGDDVLMGMSGNDTLIGAGGNDLLDGGDGYDVFLYREAFGRDTIANFEAGQGLTDRIWFDDLGLDGIDDLRMRDTREGALIDLGDLGSVLLLNTSVGDLASDDFLF